MPGDDRASTARLVGRGRATPAVVTAALLLQACATVGPPQVRGIVWQPDAATMDVHRAWDLLGAHELLIQWTNVDGADVFPGSASCGAGVVAAVSSVAGRPWARRVIVGLAALRSESASRADVTALAEAGRDAAACGATPATVSGWYFPVELDPTWSDVSDFREALALLPRPLWISVYDSANVGVEALIAQVRRAAPADVGVLFQDGVGVEARTPAVARTYLDALAKAFGRGRVRVIAEAFRPAPEGFRAATAEELRPQLRAYRGYEIYLFDGPHYVTSALIDELLQRSDGQKVKTR